MATEPAFWCIVPAAGRGVRFGSRQPKQYAALAGKPLLVRTLERLAGSPVVDFPEPSQPAVFTTWERGPNALSYDPYYVAPETTEAETTETTGGGSGDGAGNGGKAKGNGSPAGAGR